MSTTSLAVVGPFAVAIRTLVALRRTATRSSSGSFCSHDKWFPEPESRIQMGTPLVGVCGAAASAVLASAPACQAFGFCSAAAAFGAAAALALAFGAGSAVLLASATCAATAGASWRYLHCDPCMHPLAEL